MEAYELIENIKNTGAEIMNSLGITDRMLIKCYENPQVIRVINYHRTPSDELETFEKQLIWYRKQFENIDRSKFEAFMNGSLKLEKPGIILSFDDGLLNNYEYAAPLLEQYGFTGWFFVSSGLADGTEYMTYAHMRDLIQRNHVIGCHTYTHHRMSEDDTEEILNYEITEARRKLEKEMGKPVDVFCWCGGEESTYTKAASDRVRRDYNWGFMTNNELIYPGTDHFQLNRTNVEARWPLNTAKLQVSGFMDWLYRKKRRRVKQKTGI